MAKELKSESEQNEIICTGGKFEMRVIAGTARSLRLKTPEGQATRPTTDRIKETLFNMLQPSLADAVFIDLYSGSGCVFLLFV